MIKPINISISGILRSIDHVRRTFENRFHPKSHGKINAQCPPLFHRIFPPSWQNETCRILFTRQLVSIPNPFREYRVRYRGRHDCTVRNLKLRLKESKKEVGLRRTLCRWTFYRDFTDCMKTGSFMETTLLKPEYLVQCKSLITKPPEVMKNQFFLYRFLSSCFHAVNGKGLEST